MTRTAVLLDVPNVLHRKAETAARVLATLERCAASLFGATVMTRDAFALEGITPPATAQQAAAGGYEVVWCPSDRTRSMDLKRMSRVDDYLLQRTAKQRVREGARAVLIASADRDPEIVASDLDGTGVRVVFAQWDPVPNGRPASIERVCLRDFEREVAASRSKPATVSVWRDGSEVSCAPLRDGMVLGRPSRSQGSPDVDLSVGGGSEGGEHTYSRRVAVLRRLGPSWCLWRLPEAEAELTMPDGERVGAGGCAVLSRGETVVHVRSAGVEVVIHTNEFEEVAR
jgi:hypothetical protein